MSGVPKSHRTVSSVEYVDNAARVYEMTVRLCVRLPKRWANLVTSRMAGHAESLLFHAKAANSIYVTCPVDAGLRRAHLQQAFCHAQGLSSLADMVYAMQPVRTTESGTVKDCIPEATFAEWVRRISAEFELLKGVMRSDAKRHAEHLKDCTPDESFAAVQLSLFDSGDFRQ